MNSNRNHCLRPSRRPKSFKEVTRYPLLPLPERARSLRIDTIIATIPLFLLSVYHYGFRPITIALISAVMMMGLDVASRTVLKKEAHFDITPAVSGVIIALFLPASSPLWLPIMTAVFATAIKLGCGKLRFSVSHVAASVLLVFLLFPGITNVIPEVGQNLDPFAFELESFRAIPASPLEKVLSGFLPDTTTFEVFFGLNSARIGEISGLVLIIGLIYLLVRKTVKIALPLIFILTVGVYAYLSPSLEAASDFIAFDGAIYNMLGSNTLLVAVFLMSEPRRAAKTTLGTALCGIAAGLITMLLRGYVAAGLTALIAVILVDVAMPIVDKFIVPAPFGGNLAPKKEESKVEQ